jgi:plastocyanin
MTPDNLLPCITAPSVTRRHVLAVAGSAVTAIALAACRDDSAHAPLQTDPIEPNGIVVDVQSIDNTFRPDRVVVTPGTEVRWTNLGRTEHDITPADGTGWGVPKELFKPGDTYSYVVGGPGEIRYYCHIHGTSEYGMVGTIEVVADLPSETSAG